VKRSLQSLIEGNLEGALDFIAERAVLGRDRRAHFEKQAQDPLDWISNNFTQPVSAGVQNAVGPSTTAGVGSQVGNAVARGLLGAGVGAGLGGLSSMLQDKRHRRPLSSMLQGAALGGLGTAAGSLAYDNWGDIGKGPPKSDEDSRAFLEQKYRDTTGYSRPTGVGIGLGAAGAADVAGTAYNRRPTNTKWLREAAKGETSMPEDLAERILSPYTTEADLAALHQPRNTYGPPGTPGSTLQGPPGPTQGVLGRAVNRLTGNWRREFGGAPGTVSLPGPTVEPQQFQGLIDELSKTPGGEANLAVLKQNLGNSALADTLKPGERKVLERLVAQSEAATPPTGAPANTPGIPVSPEAAQQRFRALLANPKNLSIGSPDPNYGTFVQNLLQNPTYPAVDPKAQQFINWMRDRAAETTNPDPAIAEAAGKQLHGVLKSVGATGKGGTGPVNFTVPGTAEKGTMPAELWKTLTGGTTPTEVGPDVLAQFAHTQPGTTPPTAKALYDALAKNKPGNMSPGEHSALVGDPQAVSKLEALMQGEPQRFSGVDIPYETIQRYTQEGAGKEPIFGKTLMEGGGAFGGLRAGRAYVPRAVAYPLAGFLADRWLGQKELPPGFFDYLKMHKPDEYTKLMDIAQKAQNARVTSAPGADALQQEQEQALQTLMREYGR
jgi:hypothetical protein